VIEEPGALERLFMCCTGLALYDLSCTLSIVEGKSFDAIVITDLSCTFSSDYQLYKVSHLMLYQ